MSSDINQHEIFSTEIISRSSMLVSEEEDSFSKLVRMVKHLT